MLTDWRDQADIVIMRRWDSPILLVITRLTLGEVSVVSNLSGHRAYIPHAGGEILFIKWSAQERCRPGLALVTRLWPDSKRLLLRLLLGPVSTLESAEEVQQAVVTHLARGGAHHLIRLQRPRHVVTRCTVALLEYTPPSI